VLPVLELLLVEPLRYLKYGPNYWRFAWDNGFMAGGKGLEENKEAAKTL
jgi:hypothetical protein